MTTLKRETEAFNKLLPSLNAEMGKYALVIGDNLIGTFDSYGDALQAGYDKAALSPFLVKRISVAESISYFSREIDTTCRT